MQHTSVILPFYDCGTSPFRRSFWGLLFSYAVLVSFSASGDVIGDVLARLENLNKLVASSRGGFDDFVWSESLATRSHSQDFDDALLKFYNASQGCRKGERWCLVLGQKLHNVICAHLFKHEWHEDVALLGFEDIDDPRNGLPMFKPIEWAFDSSRLCFYLPENSEELTVKLLDKNIATVRLCDKGAELCKNGWFRRHPPSLSKMTFQHLDGQRLQFDPGVPLNRPFRRVLCLHAKAARRRAIRKMWLRDGEWDFPDFSTEEVPVAEQIRAWK